MGWKNDNKFVEQLGLQHVLRDANTVAASSTQLTIQDRIAFIDQTEAGGTIYLPPVGEAVGLWFYICLATKHADANATVSPYAGGTGVADSTFYENEGTLGGGTSATETITAANGWLLVMSLGDRWIVLADDLDAT